MMLKLLEPVNTASSLHSERKIVLTYFLYRVVHQHDEELNTIKKARRPGRPPSTKEDLLKRKVEALASEHESGFCE